MARTKGLWWYIGPLRIRIRRELEQSPDFALRLGRYKSRFITWCANRRIVYEDDLEEEVMLFEKRFIFSRLENVDMRLWKSTRSRIFQRDNYTCRYCGQRGGLLEIDHYIPLSRGGDNQDDNLVTACRKCNRSKKNQTGEEFINAANKDNQTAILA